MAKRVDYTGINALTRGDDWSFAITDPLAGLQGAVRAISISIRRYLDTPEAEEFAVAEGTINSASTATIPILRAVTDTIPAGKWHYNVKLVTPSTAIVRTVQHGYVEVQEWSGQLILPDSVASVASLARASAGFTASLSGVLSDPGDLLGSALVGEYYTDLGYTVGTNAWADQSGYGNDLVSSGSNVTRNTNRINGYPAITYGNGRHQRTGNAFTGLPTGSKVTVVQLAKRTGTATESGLYAVHDAAGSPHIGGFVSHSSQTPDAMTLLTFGGAQTNSLVAHGATPPVIDRFHLFEFGGDANVYFDGHKTGDFTGSYSGLASSGANMYLGSYFPSFGNFHVGQHEVAMHLVVSRVLTALEREALSRWVDFKYGTDLYSNRRAIFLMGQSNARYIHPGFRPRNCLVQLHQTDGTPLTTGTTWSAADSAGHQAAAAASANALPNAQLVFVFAQGEAEAAGATGSVIANWASDFAALKLRMDIATGRTDSLWIIPRLKTGGYVGDIAGVNAQIDAAAAADPTRIKTINTDSYTLIETYHYSKPSGRASWDSIVALANTRFGGTEWVP